jgi:hypothetical protein
VVVSERGRQRQLLAFLFCAMCNVQCATCKTFTKDDLGGITVRYWVSAGAKLKQFRAKLGAETRQRKHQSQKKVGKSGREEKVVNIR